MKDTIKLIPLPYAGASGLVYSHWDKLLKDNVILSTIELPGRGLRFKEALSENLEDMIDAIFESIKKEIKDYKYAFFGYCVSNIILYELYKRIKQEGLREPSHCIICAHPAPNIEKTDKPLKEKTDDELIEEWIKDSQFTRDDFNKKKYLERFFNVWKADCKVFDKYKFTYPILKFNCNITLISGKDDKLFAPAELVDTWEAFADKNINRYIIDGSHDFFKTNEPEVINIINKVL